MKLWKGWIIDESLKNKGVLKKIKIIKSIVEENIEGDEKEVWTIHTVEIKDKEIKKISKFLEKNIKLSYYTHFTDGKNLLIIFSGKSFWIKVEKIGKEKESGIADFKIKKGEIKIWKKAFKYGTTKGQVDSRYLLNIKE